MILFLDCYDSFSYNLTHLIESACNTKVQVSHHDQLSLEQLSELLPRLEAIVIGPGPGDPHNPKDRGVIDELWGLAKQQPLPIFGVCFGYQSLVLAFGGTVKRMSPPRHGRISRISHTKSTIFEHIPQSFEVVRYHSLCCLANSSLLISATAEDDQVEMAAEHATLPFFGVQFHPESVKSTFGAQIFQNFWELACKYNSQHRAVAQLGDIPRSLTVNYESLMKPTTAATEPDLVVFEAKIRLTWQDLAASLPEFVFLKSAAVPGQWSIFGLLDSQTPHIRSKNGTVYEGPLRSEPQTVASNANVWERAANFMSTKLLSSTAVSRINQAGLPFLGGLVGYVTYEGACLHTVNNGVPDESGMNSDVSLVFITKSVVFDETSNKIYAVGPQKWAQEMIANIELAEQTNNVPTGALPSSKTSSGPVKRPKVTSIDYPHYQRLISQCFEKLQSGDSYELCLTTQAELEFDQDTQAWQLFQQLVRNNPAPYCSFMDFDDTLIATSPERFMAWDTRKCEFRPIKGTVKKSPHMTRERATEILKTDKEQAENLMIVDLIRHDIGHLLDRVTTPQLMTVEEYHSVYQLVTSVEGEFSAGNSVRGIDILSQSLPPGSMTGAPKQRSCQLLKQVEQGPRGLYSGVQGYWGIDDRGDWSVIIRSLFKSKHNPTWRLGAGGGVTVLSTAEGEFEEMETKMASVLSAFE